MKKVTFNCVAKYNGKFYDAGEVITVKNADLESLKKQGAFEVLDTQVTNTESDSETDVNESEQVTDTKEDDAADSSNTGELKPQAKPTKGVKSK